MFKTRVNGSAIFAPAATGANSSIYEDATLKHIVLCTNQALNPLIAYLPPIPQNAKNSIESTASAVEVRQIRILDIADETDVTESTRYKVTLEQWENRFEGVYSSVGEYAYTTPAVLTGTLSSDRANIVAALLTKINNHSANNVAAYTVQTIAFNTGNVEPTVGLAVTGGTSTFTGYVAKVVLTSGAWGGTAVGTLYVYAPTGMFASGETISYTGGSVVATADGVENQDIVIIDDAGYFRNGKKGATTAYKGNAFTDRDTTILRAHTYESGQGTNMLLDVPVFDESGQELIRGNMDYYTFNGDLPVAGHTYTKVIINSVRPGVADAMSGSPRTEQETQYLIWLDEVVAGNVTDFLTDIAAAIIP
jgi:hypothetical protein